MKQSQGEVRLGGKTLKITNPSSAVKQGLALVPEERRKRRNTRRRSGLCKPFSYIA